MPCSVPVLASRRRRRRRRRRHPLRAVCMSTSAGASVPFASTSGSLQGQVYQNHANIRNVCNKCKHEGLRKTTQLGLTRLSQLPDYTNCPCSRLCLLPPRQLPLQLPLSASVNKNTPPDKKTDWKTSSKNTPSGARLQFLLPLGRMAEARVKGMFFVTDTGISAESAITKSRRHSTL